MKKAMAAKSSPAAANIATSIPVELEPDDAASELEAGVDVEASDSVDVPLVRLENALEEAGLSLVAAPEAPVLPTFPSASAFLRAS